MAIDTQATEQRQSIFDIFNTGRRRLAVQFFKENFFRGLFAVDYMDPAYQKKYADFPPLTTYWGLKNDLEVALYPVNVAPTANFDIWEVYKPNSLFELFENVDTTDFDKNRISPSLDESTSSRGQFFKRGTKFEQFYVAEYNGVLSLIRIDFFFTPINQISIGSDFTIDTGNRFRDYIFNAIAKIGSNEEQAESIRTEDESGLVGGLLDIIGFIVDSDLSDVVGAWIPNNFEVIPIPLDDSRRFRGTTNTDTPQKRTNNLLPIALIGGGLISGFIPLSVLGGALLLLSDRKD